MVEEIAVIADATLDLSGLTCPAPLLGAKQLVDELKPGQVLALISDCPGTKDDLYIWARHTGNEIVHAEPLGGAKHAFYIRKGRRTAPGANITLDMRGVTCPGPILEARLVLERMKPGEILRLLSNCPASRDEVSTWTANTRHTLAETRELGEREWEFFIRRG